MCVAFAGNQQVFAETCSGVCYDDFVIGSPSNYDNAYFEVKYVRVYGVPGEDTVINAASPHVSAVASSAVLATVGLLAGVMLAF